MLIDSNQTDGQLGFPMHSLHKREPAWVDLQEPGVLEELALEQEE